MDALVTVTKLINHVLDHSHRLGLNMAPLTSASEAGVGPEVRHALVALG